jgi:hypothetical protein
LGRVTSIIRARRAVRLAAAFASMLALGGCGGIEFQGKVFDYMGISGERGPQEDVRMAERPPLLLPPNPKTLPPPGSGVAAATARTDWPTNPEVVSNNIAKARKVEELKKGREPDSRNPYIGKPTLLDKVLGRDEAETQPVDDVPEPDPTDKPPEEVASASKKPLAPRTPEDITPKPAEDPFHPDAPDSYKGVSSGENAKNY